MGGANLVGLISMATGICAPLGVGIGSQTFSGIGGFNGIDISLSRIVKTGPEFSPRTLAVLYWCRVA